MNFRPLALFYGSLLYSCKWIHTCGRGNQKTGFWKCSFHNATSSFSEQAKAAKIDSRWPVMLWEHSRQTIIFSPYWINHMLFYNCSFKNVPDILSNLQLELNLTQGGVPTRESQQYGLPLALRLRSNFLHLSRDLFQLKNTNMLYVIAVPFGTCHNSIEKRGKRGPRFNWRLSAQAHDVIWASGGPIPRKFKARPTHFISSNFSCWAFRPCHLQKRDDISFRKTVGDEVHQWREKAPHSQARHQWRAFRFPYLNL